MTLFEERTTEHIDGDRQSDIVYETTTDRIQKLPNGDKRINLHVHNETPYGLSLFREALSHNPWFGADYHIENEQDCDTYLDILQKKIRKSDHFIILGDMDGRDSQSFSLIKRFVEGLPTKNIYLILGNNDSHPVKEYQKLGFLAVQTVVEYKNLVFSHFPVNVSDGVINIHAHLHGAADQKGMEAYYYVDGTRCVDVWTDTHTPIRLEEVLNKYKKNHPEFMEESSSEHIKEESFVKERNLNLIKDMLRFYEETMQKNGLVPFKRLERKIVEEKENAYNYYVKNIDIPIFQIVLKKNTMEMRNETGIGKDYKEYYELSYRVYEIDSLKPAEVIRLKTLYRKAKKKLSKKRLIPVTEATEKQYYRITYEGEGIYEAFKKRIPTRKWQEVLDSDALKWLPKPPYYLDGYRSYFTEKGYEMFEKYTFPVFKKYLDKRLMDTEVTTVLRGPIIYGDQYQVVVKDSLLENEDRILRTILKFNYETNEMNYYVKNKNGCWSRKNLTSEVFDKKYYLLTPKEFWDYNGGVCWDYVVYQADYFRKNLPSTEFKVFYHQTVHSDPNDAPTHTFMVFKHNKKWYWIESSWKDHMGVWEFANLPTALTFITNGLVSSAKQQPGISLYKDEFLVEYNPLNKSLFGLGCMEFMRYMERLPEYQYTKKKKLPYPKRYFDEGQYERIMGEKPIMEAHIDHIIGEPSTLFDKITLYHVSLFDVNRIEPVSVNPGNKLARPRRSSFWTDNCHQYGWLLIQLLRKLHPEEKDRGYTYMIEDYQGEKRPTPVISIEVIKEYQEELRKIPMFCYVKTFRGTELGLGTEYSVKEYTCDKTIIPDKKIQVTLEDALKECLVVDDRTCLEYCKKWLAYRKQGIHLQELIRENPAWYYFSYEKGKEIRALYAKKHPRHYWHGSSTQGLKVLIPRDGKRPDDLEKGEYTFVSPRRDFAACFGAYWHDGIARMGTINGTVYFVPTEQVNMSEPCSLYEVLDNEKMTQTSHQNELITGYPVKVYKEYHYKTFREMLEKNGVKIISLKEYERRRKGNV